MSKREFLEGLEKALLEHMSIREAAPHIKYYADYINNEIKNGKTEEEVIERLSNPRLIAKTIVDNGVSANKYNSNVYEASSNGSNQKDSYKYNSDSADNDGRVTFSINGKPIKPFIFKIIFILLLIMVIFVGVMIVRGIMWIVARIFLPIIAIVFIIRLFRRR